MIIFYLVFLEKKQPNQIKKKNRNRTETGSNRPVSVRFGFLGQKSVQTSLARFFSIWLGFLSVWLGFFFSLVFLVLGYKTETKPNRNQTKPTSFFKILIGLTGFFLRFDFFNYLFSNFPNLISFLIIFFCSPYILTSSWFIHPL